MRLVAWNANHNRQHRSFEENARLLEPFLADVLVISETQPPTDGTTFFVGDTPGLAVWARGGIVLQPHPMNDGAPSLAAGFHVIGSSELDLLAMWPVSRTGKPSYHELLMVALEHYADLWPAGRAVMVGDLNTSTKVSNQRQSHSTFVRAAMDCGLVSAYHEQTGEPHGEETVPTYLHNNGDTFHLDYGFVSQPLMRLVGYRIAEESKWFEIGDHRPIILDIGPCSADPARHSAVAST